MGRRNDNGDRYLADMDRLKGNVMGIGPDGGEARLKRWFGPLLILGILVNAAGLFDLIMEPDGALYATIAKTIATTGDWINLRVEGRDWLDKPHLPFWIAAASFRIFGINSFAYKLPALLCWGLGAWYTYRFALVLYGQKVAMLATLIYVSAAHLVISNNDVRAEPYLTAFIIAAIYHYYKAGKTGADKTGTGKTLSGGVMWADGGMRSDEILGGRTGNMPLHILAGSLFSAAAMMTKGPFVLVTIGAGFLLDWLLNGEWKQVFRPRWWLALGLTGLFILPELYCLYEQFDRHPEKLVFGRTGVSGVRFFFWDSQFGRFFNTGPIRGDGDPFFYFHTVLWAFLPWSLLLYAAIGHACVRAWKGFRLRWSGALAGEQVICLGSALATFLLFSLSRFQLPHYLNILFPQFAILTAVFICRLYGHPGWRLAIRVQGGIALLLCALLLILCWLLHAAGWLPVMMLIIAAGGLVFYLFRGRDIVALTGRAFGTAMIVYAFMNGCFYPALLHYQAGNAACGALADLPRAGLRPGKVNGSETGGTAADVYQLQEAPASYSFEFYNDRPTARVPLDSLGGLAGPIGLAGPAGLSGAGQVLVFAPARFADSMRPKGQILRSFPGFHISQLTLPFLDFRTRAGVVEEYAIIAYRKNAIP